MLYATGSRVQGRKFTQNVFVVARNMCTHETCARAHVCTCNMLAHAAARNMYMCERVTCLHMLHSALSRVKFMCLAMGLDMNQHMYAACVVARSICTCAHCALLKSAESYKCKTQHFHVSNTTTCDVSTCAEHFILPSNSFRSRRSLPTAFELHEGATVTVTRVTIS
jgi:hypothetical protein